MNFIHNGAFYLLALHTAPHLVSRAGEEETAELQYQHLLIASEACSWACLCFCYQRALADKDDGFFFSPRLLIKSEHFRLLLCVLTRVSQSIGTFEYDSLNY